ncbi:Acetoacetyl-CoA reductase [Candidatus Xenohaliotis californiensis]|uniref:Acetoacetyl-CoA reductase n=1 Tax=Candidatus Xenohaliotis californiensis TaxID=84677 RepID=A0ABP0EUY8_9RICK|nr:Acetoacetyl-CoA reductase [Candidatus Xenohaliotis californiensis]
MNKKNLAIITGGTSGIGASITKLLKQNNFIAIANYMYNTAEAENFSKKNDIEIFKWDVSNFEECQKNVQIIEKKYNTTTSILINNAGITNDRMMHKMTIEEWESTIRVNLFSCFNMSRAVIQQMRNNEFGRIINISSVNALSGCVGQTNYSASKAGVIGFTKSLALESINKGITVNAIAPGYTDTAMTKKMPVEIIGKIKNLIPAKRLCNPKEIADTMLFLINAPAITGATINVNGGLYMQ